MRITLIHWIFMSLSVLLIVGAVIYAKSASRSLEGFSVSGHTASGYMVAGMLVGTMMGGSMTVGTVQSVTIGGLHGIWMLLGACIGFIVTGLFYVSPIRRSGQSTLGGYIGLYYGSFTGTAMSLVSTLGIFFSLVASGLSGIHFIRLFSSCIGLAGSYYLTSFCVRLRSHRRNKRNRYLRIDQNKPFVFYLGDSRIDGVAGVVYVRP